MPSRGQSAFQATEENHLGWGGGGLAAHLSLFLSFAHSFTHSFSRGL